jgi:hypothetical protein
MSKTAQKWIHLIVSCILSAMLIGLGIALIISCLDIYNSGPKPYTPESIAAHFQKISLLVYLTVACVVLGIVLNLVMPQEKKKVKAFRDNAETLSRLEAKAGMLEGEFAQKAAKEKNLRKILRLCTAIACVLLAIRPLLHFMNQDNFLGDKTQCVIRAMTIALVYGAASLSLTFLCKVLCGKSIDRQIDICKASIASNGASGLKPVVDDDKDAKRAFILRCVLAVAAITFIVLGIFNGGAEAVLDKANAICMECIGMG